MTGQTMHDGVTFDVVLPEAPWGEPDARYRRPLDDAAVESLLGQVDSSEPGPWLAGVLEMLAGAPGGAALSRLDAVELGRVVAGLERVVSWARGVQAGAAGALVEAQGGILGLDQAGMVVKDRLKVTAREGSQVAVRADRCARFPQVAAALMAGRIDVRKADTMFSAGAELTDDEREVAITHFLPEAPRRTWRWLSEQFNALNTRLHGGADEVRHAAAASNVWLEPAAPGMGLLTALLPSKDANRVFNAVQAGANELVRQPGQTRRRGECRAAALTSLVTGRMVPHPIEEVPEVEATGNTGSVSVPVVGAGVMVPPVLDTDLVPVPAEGDGVLSTAPVEAGVVIRGIEVPATINVTVPATVLADPGDDTPGILDLLGPIPAETAREIAGEGVWHRLVTDPVTGILTDFSTTTYQPPPRLRRAVLARDRVCQVSGCDAPGSRCDLDHIDRFDTDHANKSDEPGQTRAENLHALCRRHHNLKTHAEWTVHRNSVTGQETWTSPTGHVEVYQPDPIDPAMRYTLSRGITTPESKSTGVKGHNTHPTTSPATDPTAGLTIARSQTPSLNDASPRTFRTRGDDATGEKHDRTGANSDPAEHGTPDPGEPPF